MKDEVSTACGSGRVLNIGNPPATAGGTDLVFILHPFIRRCHQVNTRTAHVAFLSFVVLLGVLACASADTYASAAAPVVIKTEPPSWWAGHTINPVRLLVRGTNLHGARVTATRTETAPGSVLVNGAGTYLFVNVKI